MINFEKLNDRIQAQLSLLVFVLVGLFITLMPWLAINIKQINLDNLPIVLKCSTSTIGFCILVLGIVFYFRNNYVPENNRKNKSIVKECPDRITCIDDPKRNGIINKFRPDLYLALENNFLNLANNPACDINIFPYINNGGDIIEKPEFVTNYGYKFDGSNMISIQMKEYFPHGKQARTFIFAVNPTEKPAAAKPMFFFSYGQRKKHVCNDGISNHDKSFGVFWGEPQPDDPIPEKFQGEGVRVFFYCEHCKEDRTSDNCDTEAICQMNLNEWVIYAASYDGEELKFYKNGEVEYRQKIGLETSKTIVLNIGGFVHHNENGAIIARDLRYSMNGFIREFLMMRKLLSGDEIRSLTDEIKKLLP